jgi:GNAT superfamily N-acetyltransferase
LSDVAYRPYAPGDEAQILVLYQAAFGITLSIDEWRWHFSHGAIIELAEFAGRIIGHYAVQPRPFFVGERACDAGLVIGSMVAPEFRNITTFIELAKRAYERCKQQGIPFVYAFPNDNVWLVRLRMLDWKALPSVATLGIATRELGGDIGDVVRLDGPIPRFDWLARPAGDHIRSSDPPQQLDWRLRERPGIDYPIYIDRDRGYIALKRYGDVGHIVALRTAPGSSGENLLARAAMHFAELGVERITTWNLPASPHHELITSAGFVADPGAGKNFGYLAFDDAFMTELADANRWDVTMLDSDVF